MTSPEASHDPRKTDAEDDDSSAEDAYTSERPQTPHTKPTSSTPSSTPSKDFSGPERGAGQENVTTRSAKSRVAEPVGATSRSKAGLDTTLSEDDIARLRDAVHSKIVLQQRTRGVQSPHSPKSPFTTEPQRPQPPTHLESTSSTLTEATTSSTESTESGRTVRGSVPVTPASAVRTPSYPFPYVASPAHGSGGMFQPFTTLSPTMSYRSEDPARFNRMPSLSSFSEVSTPLATSNEFMPASAGGTLLEDPRFPTPNLYNLILELGTEPGLDAWWSTVTRIMHESFKAERAILATPADPTDIENVPWGQKATFSMNGPEEFVSRRTLLEQTLQSSLATPQGISADPREVKPRKLHVERLRPALEQRHSYAGPAPHTRDLFAEAATTSLKRPRGPQRVVTHAPGMPGGVGPGRPAPKHGESTMSIRHTSITDPDFSSVAGGVDAGPHKEIFATLRALNHEIHPLIERSGVHQVLERGRIVTVTRDYSMDSSDESRSQEASTPIVDTTQKPNERAKAFKTFVSAAAEPKREYEEYEQLPCSPWAQSPAPSPAIQADEEHNPFFPSAQEHMERSFDPENAPRDYSSFDQVEAIGIDRASTVLHIPLVHPTLSQPMQSMRMKTSNKPGHAYPKRSNTVDNDRKAPIAILSILSSTVPYPANLVASLRLLGPHLATSLALAQQFSYTHLQATNARRLRSAPGQVPDDIGINLGAMTLSDIVSAGLDELPTSLTGSITSPSEYSGRSRHSPLSSPLGTPGWEPGSQHWAKTSRGPGTPGVPNSSTSDYFGVRDQEERAPPKANVSQSSSSKSIQQQTIQEDDVDPLDKASESATASSAKSRSTTAIHSSEQTEKPPPLTPRMPSVQSNVAEERRHSVLHSYGADYQASFGMSAVTADDKKMQAFGHARTQAPAQDMPPPSERLLRTIIDSLPVQVFTAAPESGNLTWVNSKFLIYRGQDSRQVLGDPWQAIHPEDRREYMDIWQRCLKTGQQLQQKVRLQRFDGSYRWFYVRAAPLKDKRQHTVHWIGTNMDFHEQHIAEQNSARQQEIEASEAKYRALANSSPQIVFAVNRSNGVIFCNSQWMTYSGQSEAQALGAGFMDHVHPDDLSKCRLPEFDDGSDEPTNVPTSLPAEPQRTTSTSAYSSSGSSETEKANSSSTDSVSPVVHMPQRKLSELATTGILKVSRDPDGRQFYSTEVRLKSKDGDYRWHLVRVLLAEPTLRTRTEEETWYGTCTDINDHKTLERDLKETMDEKSRFLSNMSHEIRTPLNGITGMVNFLIDSNLTAEQMEHVNIIRASTEGLRGLINDILDLSKAEAGMIQLNVDWMYVRDLIEEVNDLTSTMAIDKGIELNYLIEPDVPPQIKGDRFRIRQILLNVVGNAIKFTQQGEVFIRCSVMKDENIARSKSEISIRFDIVDTGRGFTDKEAEVLFKRFSQIDGSSTRQHGGTGLGLVISRQLTQLHGGDMSARSSPGKGSTFTFYIITSLPTRSDHPPAPPVTPAIPSIPIEEVTMPAVRRSDSLGSVKSKILASAPTMSPANLTPDLTRESPGVSSASSDLSLRSATRTASNRSTRSSISSHLAEVSLPASTNIKLVLPTVTRTSSAGSVASSIGVPGLAYDTSTTGDLALTTVISKDPPPMFSIMVVAPLKYSREATVQHVDKTLPKNIPYSITACGSMEECTRYIQGPEPVLFTHVVIVLHDVDEIIKLMQLTLSSHIHAAATLVIITDLTQRRSIIDKAAGVDVKALEASQRLTFVFKPLKPSRFGAIFDPRKEREMSADRAQDSAQQVALSQKQVFEQLTKRLGNRDKRVLLVEDNKVNQMVILKFFGKVAIRIETVMDGVQCTDKVFAHPHGYYSIILCDLHMPNKDGYQTCKEIRKWEKKNKHKHLPIIALSANVLGDVYQKCVDAGFNSYITKPVDFKELSSVLMAFMDPSDPDKPHEFMKTKVKPSGSKAKA